MQKPPSHSSPDSMSTLHGIGVLAVCRLPSSVFRLPPSDASDYFAPSISPRRNVGLRRVDYTLHLFSTTREDREEGGRRSMHGRTAAHSPLYPKHVLPFQRNFPLLNRDPKSAALFISSLLCVLLIFMPPAISFSRSNGLALGSSSFS